MAKAAGTQESPQTPPSVPPVTPSSKRKIPRLSLTHPRKQSEGAIADNSSSTATLASSSFRSLRNLLPFGQGKTTTSDSNANGTANGVISKGPFGFVRRSIAVDRRASEADIPSGLDDPQSEPSALEDIKARVNSVKNDGAKPKANVASIFPTLPIPLPRNLDRQLPPIPSSSPLGTDLSTIIEAEISATSNNIPSFDNSHFFASPTDNDSFGPDPGRSSTPIDFVDTANNSATAGESDTPAATSTTGDSDSAIHNMSPSRVAEEGFDPMAEDYAATKDWFTRMNHYAVDESADPNLNHPSSRVEPGDLRLGVSGAKSTTSDLSNNGPISTRSSKSTTPLLIPPGPSQKQTANLQHDSPNGDISPASLSRALGSQSLLNGRSAARQRLRGISLFRTPSERMSSDEGSRRTSIDNPRPRHLQPPSPLIFSHSNQSYVESTTRTSSQSAPVTPSRHESYHHLGKRPPLGHMPPTPSTSPSDVDVPPSILNPSHGTTSHARLFLQSRSSLDSSTRSDILDRDRTFLLRSRKRSMSLASLEGMRTPRAATPGHGAAASIVRPSTSMSVRTSTSGSRPSFDQMGPRTLKSLAAGGLHDGQDEDGGRRRNVSPHHSRFGSQRLSAERDAGSRYVSSRMTFSDGTEPNVPWTSGYGGASHATMTLDSYRQSSESPTFSNSSRTNFSTAARAPSPNSYSFTHRSMQASLQAMKEKHDLATEALLAALADSQRTTKILCEENDELRQRCQTLEIQLEVILRQNGRSHLNGSPRPHAHSRRSFECHLDATPTECVHKPNPPLSTRSPSMSPQEPPTPPDNESMTPFKPQRKRFSAASSIFPVLPSNMSTLLNEEVPTLDHSHAFSPRTASLSSFNPSSLPNSKHAPNNSLSSNGSVSPTAETFSTEVTGSPTSLLLKPEHELHLRDLANFDSTIQTEEVDITP